MFRYIRRSISSLSPLEAKQIRIKPEFDHIKSQEEVDWLNTTYEALLSTPLSIPQRLNIFRMLEMASQFESFTHKKFTGYKRYSGEGTESLVPCIYSLLENFHIVSKEGNCILSLAHRGKLAVIVSVLQYPLRSLFHLIKGNTIFPEDINKDYFYFLDDITTHLATTGKRFEFDGLKVSLLHNPSHLEINGPVGQGKTRAKIERGKDAFHLWVHGDAAVAGQGVLYEALQMAKLPDFSVGGTLHVVVNNQLGFTTPESLGRSSDHTTDIFKLVGSPVVHINAMYPEEIVKMAKLAVLYRQKFKNDFCIELVGYRKYGHNEGDEPAITSPHMYNKIRNQIVPIPQTYARHLLDSEAITEEKLNKIKSTYSDIINEEFNNSSIEHLPKNSKGMLTVEAFNGRWSDMSMYHSNSPVETGYSIEKLREIAKKSVELPPNFRVHSVVQKGHINNRLERMASGKIDWSTAETLAIGSLLLDGYSVRLCGEDSTRGTFTQRHGIFHCQDTEDQFSPLKELGKFNVVNSLLSELAVLGFEYGYSIDSPENLVLWEAQFGDFANMAQPIIDQYISSGEAKWLRQSGLVMLLPHGQEGNGPDHSSGRLERAMELVNDPLAKQVNLEVANMVIPSNYFHILRRNMLRNFRRPLILGTPKSGLRHKLAISDIEEFGPASQFKPTVFTQVNQGSDILIVCNGKIYFDILTHFEQHNMSVLLVEQISPFPYQEIKDVYSKGFKKIVWAQEEPRNSGFYRFAEKYLREISGSEVDIISRPGMAASAVGASSLFKKQYEQILLEVSKLFKI